MGEEADAITSDQSATTQSPFKKLLSGSVVYGLGTIAVQTITILLMPLLTNHLSPSEYGIIALLNFVGLLLSAIFSFGLSSSLAICYFDVDSSRWKRQVVSTSFLLMLVASALLVVLTCVSISSWSYWLVAQDGYQSACLYLSFSVALTLLNIPFDNKIRLDDRPLRFIAASFVSTLAIGGLTLWFVIGANRGVFGYFEALLLGRLISFVMFFSLAGGVPEVSFSAKVARMLIKLGLPLMPQFLILYFLQFGNIELLKQFSNLENAGLYSAGLTLGLASNVIVSSIGNAWAPFFLSYSTKQAEASTMFGRMTKYYILGVGLVSLLFYYFAKLLIILLAAPQYFSGYQVIGPIATSMFMLGLFNMLLPPVYFAKEVGRITTNGIIAVIAQLILASVLIPPLGLIGAAWTSVCVYTLYTFLLYALNTSQPRYFKIKYEWERLGPFLILYMMSCVLLSFAGTFRPIYEASIFIFHFLFMLGVTYVVLDRAEVRALIQFLADLLLLKSRKVIGKDPGILGSAML